MSAPPQRALENLSRPLSLHSTPIGKREALAHRPAEQDAYCSSGLRLVPPSTLYSAPVMKPASSDARKATSAATSFGSPNRLSGIRSCIAAANCWIAASGRPSLPKMAVLVGPGLTELTRILRGASS